MMRHAFATCTLAFSLTAALMGCAQTPAAGTAQTVQEQETTQETTEQTPPSAPAPITFGRDEENVNLMLANHTYTLETAHEVDGRQGIAVTEDGYVVSGSQTLSVYDSDWNLKKTNGDPFANIEDTVNHLGDIDYYQGEIFAGVENFLDGEAQNIQIVVYDANTLEPARTFPFDPESGQNEVSGIAVDSDNKCVWMCSWADGESGRYLYRYDLKDGTYLGKYHLQAAPQWIQGICYLDGYMYLTADDGTADDGECDHVWKARVDLSSTSWRVSLERTLDDVTMAGEVEGISFDQKNQQMLIAHNRGARIVLGMPQGFYEGYDEEVHEVYAYDMEPVFRPLDYRRPDLWVELPNKASHEVDTFLVLPTVNLHSIAPGNEDVNNLRHVSRCQKTLKIEQGIVADSTNVFCPLYRQKTINCYLKNGVVDVNLQSEAIQAKHKRAYSDVRDAFEYYLKHLNDGRPIIMFGFSQGADMLLDLLADYADDKDVMDRLVCAYVIGMPLTEDYLAAHPSLKAAQSAEDTGVIVSYNVVDQRALASDNTKQVSINPLNWRCDTTPAPAAENLGFTLVDSDGTVTSDQAAFCGAHIDKDTGLLVIDDIADPSKLEPSDVFGEGNWHLYDLSLFYRNLQQNVEERIDSYLSQESSLEAAA